MDSISRLQVTKLLPEHLDHMPARRLGTGIAPRTAFHIRAVLRTVLNAAIPQLIATNPAAKSRGPDVPDQEMLTLSIEEVGELIKVSQNHRDCPLWSFLVGSGVRLGEALGLRCSDYDEKTGQLQIRRQVRRVDGRYALTELKTKGSRRTLRLTGTAPEALERQRQQQAGDRTAAGQKWEDDEVSRSLIFHAATGKPMNGPSINHRLHKALAATRLPNVRIHDLRRTYPTLALKEGASVLEVSRALGHSKPTVTLNVYSHSSDESQRRLATTADGL